MVKSEPVLEFICASADFTAASCHNARWLEKDKDYDLYREQSYWGALGGPPTIDEWRDFHTQGYQYCAVIREDRIASLAAVWKYSEKAWELAAVRTDEALRRRGFGKAVCSFVTSYILINQRIPTCHVRESNTAMIRTAEVLGFKRVIKLQPLPTKE